MAAALLVSRPVLIPVQSLASTVPSLAIYSHLWPPFRKDSNYPEPPWIIQDKLPISKILQFSIICKGLADT